MPQLSPFCSPGLLCAVDAVLFDLDGTLLDSSPDLAAAVDKMRFDRGLPGLPFEQYRPLAGAGARGLLSVAFGITPIDPAYENLKQEFFTNYEACLAVNTHVFDGVAQVICRLHQLAIPWGVVTNKASRFALPLTQAFSLFESASAVVCGDTTAYSKPHPAPLVEAARLMSVEPARCVYVGDDERDILAGRAAGMTTVAAAYGYLGIKADPALWKADFLIAKPTEVLSVLNLV